MMTLKAVVGLVLMPLPIAGALLVVAAVLWRRHCASWARLTACAAAVVVVAATTGVVPDLLLFALEQNFPPVLDARLLPLQPRFIVVLGSGYDPGDGLPITAALDEVAVVRLAEGIRLQRQLAGSVLILSGGPTATHPPSAYGYREAALALGVAANSLMVIDTPVDTATEIRDLRAKVGGDAVLLVTSGPHMRRAMAYCARWGVRAIPAPAGTLVRHIGWRDLASWLPSARNLLKSETVLHEYYGLVSLLIGSN